MSTHAHSASRWSALEETSEGWRLTEQAAKVADQTWTSQQTEQLASRRDRTHDNDPTQTKTIQRRYAQKLRGRFSDINTEIRAGVRDRDVFGLREEQLADYNPDRLRDYSFDRTAQKERQFIGWLENQLEKGVLATVSERENRYVHEAYIRGLKNSNQNLKQAGVDIPEEDVRRLVKQPIHQDKLELMYARNFQALQGITDEVDREVSRVLTDSLAEGVNPREAARRLTDRIDKIGKTRSTVLARTEIMNTHNDAALSRYEQVLGSDAEVEVIAEVMTAQDERVCEDCSPMHGERMTLAEARGDKGPIYHPQCRCTVAPIVG